MRVINAMNVYNTLKVRIIYLYDIKEIVLEEYYKKRDLQNLNFINFKSISASILLTDNNLFITRIADLTKHRFENIDCSRDRIITKQYHE